MERPTPVTDARVERILSDLETDTARAVRRAVTRLSRLSVSDRQGLDPYALLLRPAARSPRPRG